MSIFLLLLFKLIPLYGVILLGYVAGKYLQIPREPIGVLLIYIISPLVIFTGVSTASFSASLFVLPLLFYILCSLFGLISYYVASVYWKDGTASILGFSAGTGNTGYFGIPVALALFGEQVLGTIVLCILGYVLYESTVGLYITSRGNFSPRESLKKVFSLPLFYAFLLGLFVQLLHISLPKEVLDILGNIKGAYSTLGMMLIGLGLAQFSKVSLDLPFMGASYVIKFLLWPLVVGICITIDIYFFHFFTSELYKIMLLMSIVPLAANTVAYASTFNLHPEKTALTVFVSTILALFIIPLVFTFLS